MIDMVRAVEAFGGDYVLDNFVRLFVLFVGTTLALMCLRFAWLAWRKGDRFRIPGILSFGCIVATPAIAGYDRFGQPLNWLAYGFYLIGLVLGVVALYANYHFAPDWARLGKGSKRRKVKT